MKKLIVTLALLLCVSPVKANPVAEMRAPEGVLTLRSEPCENPAVADQVKPEFLDQFRRVDVEWAGEKLAACWYEQPEFVFIIDEAGRSGVMPKALFKKPGVEV